jgi:hypothetical protein
MSPDRRPAKPSRGRVEKRPPAAAATRGRSRYPATTWDIVYFKRHRDDDAGEVVPGRQYLLASEAEPRSEMVAILKAVASAPPPAFSGGGKWEAMKGDMAGYYQAKVDTTVAGHKKHYRLFCLLDRNGSAGLPGPSIIVIDGRTKPYLTLFSAREYAEVRGLGSEFLARSPRSIDAA